MLEFFSSPRELYEPKYAPASVYLSDGIYGIRQEYRRPLSRRETRLVVCRPRRRDRSGTGQADRRYLPRAGRSALPTDRARRPEAGSEHDEPPDRGGIGRGDIHPSAQSRNASPARGEDGLPQWGIFDVSRAVPGPAREPAAGDGS